MEPIRFKYRPIDDAGYESGIFSSRGELNENGLVLDKWTIPISAITQVVNRYRLLTIVYGSPTGQATYTIAPYGLDRKLKEAIDRICSGRWAEERHVRLQREGSGAAFRTARCPACTAIVDLTGFADTPQFYCPFCEVLVPAEDHRIVPQTAAYWLCDRCKFYSYPTYYTVTYATFYFVYRQKHYSCHVCMRRECWKMLLVNLLPPFVGFLFALYYTTRAYGAGMMDSYLPELIGANAYAHRGRTEEARALYETILQRVTVQAGVRYNLALAYANAGAWEESLDAAQAALGDCSNYTPAGFLVNQALVNLKRTDEAERFLKSWGMPPADSAKNLPGSEQIQHRTTTDPEQGIRDFPEL